LTCERDIKVTVFSGNLPFAESAYGQISQGACRWTDQSGGQSIGADKAEKLQPCCLFVRTADCSLCIFTLKDVLKDAFEGCF
jgi:hypothetical protein